MSIVVLVSGLYLGSATTLYPLDISQVGGLLKICLPTFFGYLGAATHYIFGTADNSDDRRVPRLGGILVGSLVVFYSIILTGLGAYFIINSPLLLTSKLNPGHMEISDLETVLTLGMSLLALTTNVISSYIFSRQNHHDYPIVGGANGN